MENSAEIRHAALKPGAALALGLCLILAVAGCGDQRAVSQLPGTHPDPWMVSGSPDFHGEVALLNGTAGCARCHGEDFEGGRVGVSCVGCHLTSGACVACHGGLDNSTGAPPYGLRDEVSDSTLGVGAHTLHLSGTSHSAAVTCQSCHLVPSTMLESYHLDLGGSGLDSIAEITWHGFANGGNATWTRITRTCAGTYCHGNFDGGYGSNAPVWTSPRLDACGTCHDTGTNPSDLGLVHQIHITPNGLICADCHSEVIDSSNSILASALHVNGVVNLTPVDQALCDECHGPSPGPCTRCHGGIDNSTGAPPRGLHGETAATALAVGAHTTHVEGSYVSDAFNCNECHLVPARLTDSGHWDVDSTAEIIWGTLAGTASQWDRATRECSSTYCHGNFSGGYAANTPIWTGPAQAACGSCHDDGANPGDLSGRHRKHVRDENVECFECHSTTVDAGLAIIGKSVHVDGQKTVAFGSREMTYQNGTCSGPGACHGTKSWR